MTPKVHTIIGTKNFRKNHIRLVRQDLQRAATPL
ncbi:hypothetical protein CNECB9_5320003 [Cupriavidus necator]|uniref:Uncharacterized protein n=1 Tax=Cupriavidus necator TaxID=106590 RepID=A0A1K0IPW6_CUPNE|nr:hypothetical protein CNECB9_5320003 [Cupriavidus necator]